MTKRGSCEMASSWETGGKGRRKEGEKERKAEEERKGREEERERKEEQRKKGRNELKETLEEEKWKSRGPNPSYL